jgi:PAS domain S-box-containing protein
MNEKMNENLQEENRRLHATIDTLRQQMDGHESSQHAGNRLFHAAADTLLDIVFTVLPDGGVDYLNGLFFEITGMAPDEALGKGWLRALHAEDQARVTREMHDAIAAGTPFESHFRLKTSDGSYRRFTARAHPLCDDNARIVRWVGTAIDIHDLLASQDALDEAKQQRNDLVHTIIHDLRNVTAPIQNAVVILSNANANPIDKGKAIDILGRQLRELQTFLTDLKKHATP